jgi:hypothetical protein
MEDVERITEKPGAIAGLFGMPTWNRHCLKFNSYQSPTTNGGVT